MKKEYKTLIDNSILFTITNVGSKILSFILVPIYTYVLTTTEYGITDLISTTLSLLLPIVTLSIFDAVLRFAMNEKYDRTTILSNGLVFTFFLNVIIVAVATILSLFFLKNDFKYYIIWIALILCFQTLYSLLSQYSRAIGKLKLFAFCGVLNTFFFLILNIVLIVIYKMGVNGYIYSMAISFAVVTIIYSIKLHIWEVVNFKDKNTDILKLMLKYSVPLIPNSLMWWIITSSDRYIILYYLGASINGIYAVATKIPTIISLFNGIFFQAWQLSAIEQMESQAKDRFYSNIFKLYYLFLILATSGVFVVIKPIVNLLFESSYQISWIYSPLLLLAVLFQALSSFFGAFYIADQDTKTVFKSSCIGAVINLVGNLLLVNILGLQAVCLTTFISFFVIFIYRCVDTKKIIKIDFNLKFIIISILIISLQVVDIIIFKFNLYVQLFYFVCMLIVGLVENKNVIRPMISELRRKNVK